MRNFKRKHITVQKTWAIMQVDSRKKEKEAEIYKIHGFEEPNIKEKIKWDNEMKSQTSAAGRTSKEWRNNVYGKIEKSME